MEFRLKEGMRLGVATAATQIEGGDVGSNWNDWYRRGRIKDGTDPAADNDHWEKWEEDVAVMAQMGLQLYRFGIEWARIVPEPSKVDEEAIACYRREILALKERNIAPLLTIHHFTNPMWFENMGGFTKRENLHHYLELVELTADCFGDLVSDYITINEPNVYATNSFMFGMWPPGKTSLSDTIRVMENMAYCHIKAYEILHSKRKAMGYTDTKVGVANHLRVFAPKNEKNICHRISAKLTEYLFQGALLKAMSLGKFPFPLRNFGHLPQGEYSDFNGVNYYSRSTVSGIGDGVRENSPRNDLNWEIYPAGITECVAKLQKILPRPLWITENGTCDNDDRFRSRYIYEHLKQVCQSDLPFERYYHWCFCDNFEWIEGNSARFGLVSVDPVTRHRTVKNSGNFYAQIIARGGVDKELYDTFVSKQEYEIR